MERLLAGERTEDAAPEMRVSRRTVEELQARHIITRPHMPRTNAKAERFIRTANELWAYVRPFGRLSERRA